MNQITFANYGRAWTTWQSSDRQINPVPEPVTYGAILTGAALGLLFWRRRNKSTTSGSGA